MGAGLSRQRELSDALFWKRHGAWSQSKKHFASHGGQMLYEKQDNSSWLEQHDGGTSDGSASYLQDVQGELSKPCKCGELSCNGGTSLCGVMSDPCKAACAAPLDDGQMLQAGGSSTNYNGADGGKSHKNIGNSHSGGGSLQVKGSKFGHPGRKHNSYGGGHSQVDGMVHSFGQEDGMVHTFGGGHSFGAKS